MLVWGELRIFCLIFLKFLFKILLVLVKLLVVWSCCFSLLNLFFNICFLVLFGKEVIILAIVICNCFSFVCLVIGLVIIWVCFMVSGVLLKFKLLGIGVFVGGINRVKVEIIK